MIFNIDLSEESDAYQINSGEFGLEEVGSMNARTEKCFLFFIILILSLIILIDKLKDVIQLG